MDGVDSAWHPSEVGKLSASMLVSCVEVATHPGLCQIALETAEAAPTIFTEYGPNGCDGTIWANTFKYMTEQTFSNERESKPEKKNGKVNRKYVASLYALREGKSPHHNLSPSLTLI